MEEAKKIKRNKRALLEAALFMSSSPLSMKKLVRILRTDIGRIEGMLQDLENELQEEKRGIRLVRTKEGYQFKVKPPYLNSVRGLARFQDLRRGLLKVLAIIAYKQPITQSDIVKIIGNRTYEYVKTLVNRGLIKAVKSGRTRELVLTNEFADYFGLESVDEARSLFEGMNIEKLEKEDEKNEGSNKS